MVIELRSDCICERPNIDETDWEPASECFGCFKEAYEDAQFLLTDWRDANNLDADGDVDVHAMLVGWQRETIIGRIAANEILEMLLLNGDYRIQLKTDTDNNLVAIRTSHDEPTGARFEFRAVQTN